MRPERNKTRLERNETRGGNFHLSGTVTSMIVELHGSFPGGEGDDVCICVCL